MKFTGTEKYVATDDLQMAVNAAIALQRPLLIKGEPGTGKTLLAEEMAAGLGMRLIPWHIKSTTKAQQVSTNTMRFPVCGTPSWAMKRSKTSATTS